MYRCSWCAILMILTEWRSTHPVRGYWRHSWRFRKTSTQQDDIASYRYEFPKISDPWDLPGLRGLLRINYGPTGGVNTLKISLCSQNVSRVCKDRRAGRARSDRESGTCKSRSCGVKTQKATATSTGMSFNASYNPGYPICHKIKDYTLNNGSV